MLWKGWSLFQTDGHERERGHLLVRFHFPPHLSLSLPLSLSCIRIQCSCYTIEASFHAAKKLNFIPPKYNKTKKLIEPEGILTNPQSSLYEGKPAIYNRIIYEDMGRVIIC